MYGFHLFLDDSVEGSPVFFIFRMVLIFIEDFYEIFFLRSVVVVAVHVPLVHGLSNGVVYILIREAIIYQNLSGIFELFGS